MKNKSKKKLPFGISLLRIFYIINAFLFVVTTLIFSEYLDIIIFGKVVQTIPALLVRLILIIFPLYLVFGLSYLRKEAYPLAITYHLFFIINGLIKIFNYKNLKLRTPLEIIIKPEYKITRVTDFFGASFQMYLIQILGIIIGLVIILYLFKKRKIFIN